MPFPGAYRPVGRTAPTSLVRSGGIVQPRLGTGAAGGGGGGSINPFSDLVFPTNPGTAGTRLPEKDNTTALEEFNRLDYEGWGDNDGENERMQWVTDPSGETSRTVVEFEVRGTDSADQFGGCRTSIWKDQDVPHGTDGWRGLSFYIPVGFVYPDAFFLFFQHYYPGGGSPPMALEANTPPGGGSTRNYLYWSNRVVSTSATLTPLAAIQEGEWHYVVSYTVHSSIAANGVNQVWLGIGALPDLGEEPLVDWHNKTSYGTSDTRDNILNYRGLSGDGAQIQFVYYRAFRRGATSDFATTNL